MQKKYIPSDIEAKWQKIWDESGMYTADDSSSKPKRFVMEMLPYPSGASLHVGHMLGYVATDVYARFSRMSGYNVLRPVGWDAFGLPAENYAIKTQTLPQESTAAAIKASIEQLKRTGMGYDWAREVNTSDPDYYKWTQWLFIQFYKEGLAYKKTAAVNWCPKDQTVLANEQVIDGKCERCDTEVEQKELEQWFMAITKYADELLEDLDHIDWPASTKAAQRNWIGRKEGIEITYAIDGSDETVTVFTTRPDTNFGATFIAMAPEHPLVEKITTPENQKSVSDYIESVKNKTELARESEGKDKTGVFTGSFAINPLNGAKMPIWISDFVLSGYGTGALVGVPGHDMRDFDFAFKFGLPIVRVVIGSDGDTSPITSAAQVQEEEGKMINSGFLDGMDIHAATEKMMDHIEKEGYGKRVVSYHLRDWLISRQRYWGAPVPMIYCEKDGWNPVPESELPVLLPTDVDFQPTGESPITRSKTFQEGVTCPVCHGNARREVDTLDTFVDSSWYFLRYCDASNTKEAFAKEKVDKWMPVDLYIGGDHATTHLIFARFFVKALRDMGLLSFDEPFARFFKNGHILGEDNRKMSKRWGNVINPLDLITKFGADTMRMYEMFMGPLEDSKSWSTSGVEGIYRFLNRVWTLMQTEATDATPDKEALFMMHTSIKKITDDIEALQVNTAVSHFMKWYNFLSERKHISQEEKEIFLKLLAPFAPHMSEELWHDLKGEAAESIHKQSWPVSDNQYLARNEALIVVQVNGKLRGNLTVENSEAGDQAKVEALARQDAKISSWISTGVKKVIFVPGKIINFVV